MTSPNELARAISALINSKPRSPTIEELEGVIRTHCPPVTVGPASEELKGLIPPRKLATVSRDDSGFVPSGGGWFPSGEGVTRFSTAASADGPVVDVYRIEPDKLQDALGKHPESPRARWAGPPAIEIEGVGLSIYYADPLCLMCLPDDKAARAINGNLIHPNRLYVRWYDDEHDQVCLEPVPSWGAARALSPHVYDALMQARRADQMVAAMVRKTAEQAAKPPMISVSDVVRKDVFFGAGGVSAADGSLLPPSGAWIAKHSPDQVCGE